MSAHSHEGGGKGVVVGQGAGNDHTTPRSRWKSGEGKDTAVCDVGRRAAGKSDEEEDEERRRHRGEAEGTAPSGWRGRRKGGGQTG